MTVLTAESPPRPVPTRSAGTPGRTPGLYRSPKRRPGSATAQRCNLACISRTRACGAGPFTPTSSGIAAPFCQNPAAALRHVAGFPDLGLLRRLRPVPTRSAEADLRTAVWQLLLTPRATDGIKVCPAQRGSKGDLTLPSAAVRVDTARTDRVGNADAGRLLPTRTSPGAPAAVPATTAGGRAGSRLEGQAEEVAGGVLPRDSAPGMRHRRRGSHLPGRRRVRGVRTSRRWPGGRCCWAGRCRHRPTSALTASRCWR